MLKIVGCYRQKAPGSWRRRRGTGHRCAPAWVSGRAYGPLRPTPPSPGSAEAGPLCPWMNWEESWCDHCYRNQDKNYRPALKAKAAHGLLGRSGGRPKSVEDTGFTS